jgi:hypothetical protein
LVGAAELETLGIHPLLQLRNSLRRYEESSLDEGIDGDGIPYSQVEKTDESDISKDRELVARHLK